MKKVIILVGTFGLTLPFTALFAVTTVVAGVRAGVMVTLMMGVLLTIAFADLLLSGLLAVGVYFGLKKVGVRTEMNLLETFVAGVVGMVAVIVNMFWMAIVLSQPLYEWFGRL